MKKNLEYKQNETISITARWKDADGNPFLLDKGTFQIRERQGTADPALFTLSQDAGIFLDQTNGWAIVTGVPSAVPPGTYKYDLLVRRTSDGARKVLLEGDIKIMAGVSVIV